MKPYRGPSVRAGANAAVGADEEKFFAVCRRRKVRRINRSSTSTDGLRGPPVFFLRFMRQASFGSPRVSFDFRNDPKLIYPRLLIRFLLDFGMSGEANPRNHDRPSSRQQPRRAALQERPPSAG